MQDLEDTSSDFSFCQKLIFCFHIFTIILPFLLTFIIRQVVLLELYLYTSSLLILASILKCGPTIPTLKMRLLKHREVTELLRGKTEI